MGGTKESGRGGDALRAIGGMLVQREHVFAEDTLRGARNMRESLRLFALALIVSAAMGVAAWAFLSALDAVTGFREAHLVTFALLPVVSVFTAWLYRNHGKGAARGNNLVIDCAVSGRDIPPVMAPFTFVCSVATHLAGGSAGREGTAVQIGGTIADIVSRRFKLGECDHQDLIMAGISAAFGGVFGTPLAGAFFGMEMCFVGKLQYSAGAYCLVASFVGDAVATALGAGREAHLIGTVMGEPPAFLAALGMIGVFGVALNVPITTIMLGVDLFGGAAAPYYVIVSFVGYLVAGHRGVYPAQRIVTPKWRSLGEDRGHTVDEVIAEHHSKVEGSASKCGVRSRRGRRGGAPAETAAIGLESSVRFRKGFR